HDLLRPLLTSALRSECLAAYSVAAATQSRSPGVSSAAFRAQSPGLRFASLMDMDFAVSGPLVRRSRLVPGFCPSTRAFARCFLQTPPRGDSPCTLLALHLHQVERRTFTSKLLSMPSTPLNRYAIASRRAASIIPRERSWVAGEAPCLEDRGVHQPPSKTGVAYDNRGYHPAASAYDRGHDSTQAVRGHTKRPHPQLQAVRGVSQAISRYRDP